MTNSAAMIALGGLFSIPVLVALHMLAVSHFGPEWLARLEGHTLHNDSTKARKFWGWAYYIGAMIGFGIIGYGGVYHSLWWLPSTLGYTDEGGYTTYRHAIAAAIGIWLAFQIPSMTIRAVSRPASDR